MSPDGRKHELLRIALPIFCASWFKGGSAERAVELAKDLEKACADQARKDC